MAAQGLKITHFVCQHGGLGSDAITHSQYNGILQTATGKTVLKKCNTFDLLSYRECDVITSNACTVLPITHVIASRNDTMTVDRNLPRIIKHEARVRYAKQRAPYCSHIPAAMATGAIL